MKSFLFAAALLSLGLAACGSKDDFTGTWKGLNTRPGVAMVLDITHTGDTYRVEQEITTTVAGGKPIVSRETLSGVAKNNTLGLVGGLVTLSIDQKSGHLMGPGMANVTEFEKVS